MENDTGNWLVTTKHQRAFDAAPRASAACTPPLQMSCEAGGVQTPTLFAAWPSGKRQILESDPIFLISCFRFGPDRCSWEPQPAQ